MQQLEILVLQPNLTLSFGTAFAGVQERLHANLCFFYCKGIHNTCFPVDPQISEKTWAYNAAC